VVTAVDAKRWSNLIFAGLFVLALILFSRILLPFLMPVLLGGFLVVLFRPVQEVLGRRLGGHASLCAGLSTLSVFLLLLLPLVAVGWMVGREVLEVMQRVQVLLERVDLRHELLASLPQGLNRYLRMEAAGTQVEQVLLGVVSGGAAVLKELLGASTELALNLFLLAMAMYYFFLDGRRLWSEATRLIPLDRRYLRAFAQEFTDVAHAVVYGNTLTALVQGGLGLVGLLVARVPHAGVWGAAMVLVALVPLGGTALIWFPLGLTLLLSGRVNEGIFLMSWGAFVVSSVDNFLRPRLCGARMTLHPLLIFLSVFGGLAVFGMMGLLVGPLIASLFMTMVRIYRRDFLGVEEQEASSPRVSSPSMAES